MSILAAGFASFCASAYSPWLDTRLATPPDQPVPSLAIVRRSLPPSDRIVPLDAAAALLFIAGGKGPRADRIAVPSLQDTGGDDSSGPQGGQLLLAADATIAFPALQNVALGLAPADRDPPWSLDLPDGRPRYSGLDIDRAAIGNSAGKPLYFGGLTEAEFRAREKRCLATAIYFEARGEPVTGQLAVAQTIMNRVRSASYPDTICGVVYQGAEKPNACQFSFACDRIADVPKEKPQWETASELARRVIEGEVWLAEVGYASHYHATYVRPDWIVDMRRLTRIGSHIFYRAKFLPLDEGSGRASVP